MKGLEMSEEVRHPPGIEVWMVQGDLVSEDEYIIYLRKCLLKYDDGFRYSLQDIVNGDELQLAHAWVHLDKIGALKAAAVQVGKLRNTGKRAKFISGRPVQGI